MGKVNRKRWSLYLKRKREKQEKVQKLTAQLEKAKAQERERIEAKIRKISHRLPSSVLRLTKTKE